MTIQEMQKSTRAFLLPVDVASVLECDPQCIRILARTDRAALGFPVVVTGNRTKIPRVPFLRFMGFEDEKEKAPACAGTQTKA